MTTRTEQQRASERAGYEIGRQMLDQVLDTDDQAERHRLFCAAVILCVDELHPRDAFGGFSTVVSPALQGQPEAAKGMATLAARAALAGHVCARDSTGQIVMSRWGRSMSFASVHEAEAWLAKVTGTASHGN